PRAALVARLLPALIAALFAARTARAQETTTTSELVTPAGEQPRHVCLLVQAPAAPNRTWLHAEWRTRLDAMLDEDQRGELCRPERRRECLARAVDALFDGARAGELLRDAFVALLERPPGLALARVCRPRFVDRAAPQQADMQTYALCALNQRY